MAVRPPFAFLRARRRGVSAVAGSALMVATTVGMAASLWVMVSGFLPTNAADPTVLALSNRGFHTGAAPGYCCLNDTALEVTVLRGDRQPWNEGITFSVLSADRSQLLLQGDLVPVPANPALLYLGVYHGSPDEVSVMNMGYVDADANGYASAPDYLDLRGMSKEYHGATLLLIGPEGQIATAALP